jgi:multidrug resistance protein, MATE family
MAPDMAPTQDSAKDVTHLRVFKIALPIVLSNATVPLLGAVDTGVVGQLGQAAPIGAVGIGAIGLATIYWVLGFLRMGTSGLAAQAHGAGNTDECRAVLLRALLVGFAAGILFIALQAVLFWALFAVSPASAEVETLARQYLSIRIWGAPATISLYAVTGWLIALERTRGVLVLQLVMNGLNVGLDLWFVLGLGWGVPGVAVATLIAEWTGLVLGLWLCRDAFGPGLTRVFGRIRNHAALAVMVAVNRDIMIRSVVLQACFTAFLFLSSGFGDVPLAANQILMQLLEVTAYALDGFAFAAEALVGQAIGAGRPDLTRRASVIATQWTMGGAVLLSGVFALAGPAIISLMTTAPEVRQMAGSLLPWVVAAPVIGGAAWALDGIFIGATLTRDMRQTAIQSALVYAVALIMFLAVLGWQSHGVWAALMILNITRGVTLGVRYPRVAAKAATTTAST